jgi:outer membrane protein assembly factor BamA
VQRGLVLGANAVLVRGEEFACSDPECSAFRHHYGDAPRLRYRRTGGEATVGVRPGPFERILASYRTEALDATSVGNTAAGLAPPILTGHSTLSALVGTYEMDTRDDFFFPQEGMKTLVQITFGSRLFGGDYEYSRYLLQLETAYALFGQRLRLQGALGAAQGAAPFFERFYAADYSYFAIGPAIGRALELNFSTDPRYDAFLAMGGVEYGLPLWTSSAFLRRGVLAIGVRGVYSTESLGGRRTRVSRTPVSGDVALRFDTPVGVFNLSAGYLLDNFL